MRITGGSTKKVNMTTTSQLEDIPEVTTTNNPFRDMSSTLIKFQDVSYQTSASSQYTCPRDNVPPCRKIGYVAQNIVGLKTQCCLPPISSKKLSIIDILKDQLVPLAIAIGILIATNFIAKQITRILVATYHVIKEILKTIGKFVAKIIKKILTKIGTKFALKLAEKIGTKISQTIAVKIAIKIAEAMAIKMTVKISAGVAKCVAFAAIPVVGWAIALFEAFNLLIDIWDPGGYNKLQFQSDMMDNRNTINETFDDALKKSGQKVPVEIDMMRNAPKDLVQDVTSGIINQYATAYISQSMDQIDITLLSDSETSSFYDIIQINI